MSTEERNVSQEQQPTLSEQRLIRRAKLKELQDAGQDPFQITKYVVKHHSADIKENFDALEGTMTSVAGRLMSKRGMGKAVFCDLQDVKGRIQIYVRIDELARRPSTSSRSWTSATSWAWKGRSSRPSGARSP